MKKFSAIALIALAFTTTAYGQSEPKPFPSYADALEVCRKTGKPLVVFIGDKAHRIDGCVVAWEKELSRKGIPQYSGMMISPDCQVAIWTGVSNDAAANREKVDALLGRTKDPDALDEVNAARAARGLPSFIRCPQLTAAAQSAAKFRAAHRIAGHTSNDFAHVPPGGWASGAGCAAWDPGMGWGACCTYENWTYAGASYAIGADGLRYMHLFVR